MKYWISFWLYIFVNWNYFQDTGEDVWTSNQENGGSWAWEDLLRDGNFEFPNFPPAWKILFSMSF